MDRVHLLLVSKPGALPQADTLLPPNSVHNTLQRYNKSEVASERFWAAEFRTELDAPETKEALQKYSKGNP
jgi:hypothetical protein